MADNARTTRLVALLAGNGFVLAQALSAYHEGATSYADMTFNWAFWILFAILYAVAGMGCAYFALRHTANDGAARWAENASLLALVPPLIVIVIALARGILMHIPK